MSLRRRRQRGEKPKASIDMTSLIDLTFLLLVTFIVTLPALEQGISVKLPKAKADKIETEQKKPNRVTVDKEGNIYLNNDKTPVTIEELKSTLTSMKASDEDVKVLVRGDEALDYGKVMQVIKVLHDCKITQMALVTVD